MAAPILVAGLDSRSLFLEAPVLLRDRAVLEEKASSRELLDILAREGGRLVILGTRLPDLDLPEAVRRIRSLPATRRVSILALVPAEEAEELDDTLREAGANGVLRRPLDRAQLEGWIAKLLVVPRRVDARVPVLGQVVGTPRTEEGGHFYGLSRNLSVNGMLLASPVRLTDGPDLDLELQLPEVGARVRALGRVVRDAGEVGWPYLGYGVEFLFVPPESQLAIELTVARSAVSLAHLTREGAIAGIHATLRSAGWIYEIVEPVAYEAGWLVEIRRGPREGWRPGVAGPFYVVEGPSPEVALRAAREFVHGQE
ncbi:MAG: PilZ domain-containing protein [Candidatus Rokubacteria bacterium]|nr:PilZ domain-containing protein [Candidatus Rokubacteria bacterium]